jgi:hypothetical protein
MGGMSETLKTVRIDKVNISDPKQTKNGKTFYNAGIAVDDQWHNCMLWEVKDCDDLRACEGQEIAVVFYDEEYNEKIYKKFKLPSRLQIKVIEMEMRLSTLEERFDKAAKLIKTLTDGKPDLNEIAEQELSKIPTESNQMPDPLKVKTGEIPDNPDFDEPPF